MSINILYCVLKCKKIITEPTHTTLVVEWKLNTGPKQELELVYLNGDTLPALPLGKEVLLMEDEDKEE